MKEKKTIESSTSDKNKKDIQRTIKDLIKINKMEYSWSQDEQRKKTSEKLISFGEPAVPLLLEILKDKENKSWQCAAHILGEIGDNRAIMPLIDALEEPWMGEWVEKALVRIGPVCIPEVIKKVEYRIENPIKEGVGIDHLTGSALCTIGGIRCEESVEFLNNLLDDYMSLMPEESFDPSKHDWKYVNVDFFFILESMVRQQDKRAIPHIQKARDFFPENYVDHKVCQIAIGRIKKGHVEGFLPLEVLDIAIPSGALMNLFSGGQLGYRDTFDEEYGEYFEDDDDDFEIGDETVKKKRKSRSGKKSIKKNKSKRK